jgi:hypothetical protein
MALNIKVYGLLGYDTMKAGKWVPMFQWNLLPPPSNLTMKAADSSYML